jgi:hypothetical protein
MVLAARRVNLGLAPAGDQIIAGKYAEFGNDISASGAALEVELGLFRMNNQFVDEVGARNLGEVEKVAQFLPVGLWAKGKGNLEGQRLPSRFQVDFKSIALVQNSSQTVVICVNHSNWTV